MNDRRFFLIERVSPWGGESVEYAIGSHWGSLEWGPRRDGLRFPSQSLAEAQIVWEKRECLGQVAVLRQRNSAEALAANGYPEERLQRLGAPDLRVVVDDGRDESQGDAEGEPKLCPECGEAECADE